MQQVLIGDIGSTKADWILFSGGEKIQFRTAGYNPSQHQDDRLHAMLAELTQQCPRVPDKIFYYGAGVVRNEMSDHVRANLLRQFPGAHAEIESDLLAVCRAVSDSKEGIVCILGTGSNSCVFDGNRITGQIPSLGFPLGDEGSGADIGKACVRAFYYGLMPVEIEQVFRAVLPADRGEFLLLYRSSPAPNTYLAGLVKNLEGFQEHPFVRTMLVDRFCTFVRFHIAPYRKNYPIHVTGSVAYHFQNQWRQALLREKLIPGTIVQSPIDGLWAYHYKRLQ